MSKVSKRKTKMFTMKMRTKLMVIFIIFLLSLFGLNLRLSYINMQDGDGYTIQVLAQQHHSNRNIAFRRGDILDRNNEALASSVKVYNLILDPKIMLSKEDYLEPTIEALVNYFSLDELELRSKIEDRKTSSYVIFKKHLEYDEVKDFLHDQKEKRDELTNVKGFWFEEEYTRKYPYSTLASDTIGFTLSPEAGATGLELFYNDFLTGTNGREYNFMNSDNVVEFIRKDAKDGSNITTTIDMNIQSIVEKYIGEYKTVYTPNNIAVVVSAANTGEILAMASDKGYDLNNPRNLELYFTPEEIAAMTEEETVLNLNEIWKNYCVSNIFEPGSTIKPFTIAGAIEEGKISKTQTFICDGYEMKGGSRISCHVRTGHGELDVIGAMKESCNDALMQIADLMGADLFYKQQEVSGFGAYTGIDLPSEERGLMYEAKDLKEAELATSSFGQSINTTMVQMVSGFASLVNGGNYYEPYIVKRITDSNGKIVKNFDRVLAKQTVTRETSDFIKDTMLATVVDGTGTTAAVEGYQVGGKTGTAEKLPRGQGKYLYSFLGFAPYDKAEVICYVIIDEPQVGDGQHYSSAARMYSQIMTEVLPYMDIYPN